MIEKALVIGGEWLDKILAGEKTWEIRSKTNLFAGRIALARKGGMLEATAHVGRSMGPIRPEDFPKYFDKHGVNSDQLKAIYGKREVYAWPLSDVQKLDPPVKYKHPGGGSWVKVSLRDE